MPIELPIQNRDLIVSRGNALSELPREESRLTYNNGIRRSFRGKKTEILELRDELIQNGYQCVVKEGPVYSLDATAGTFIDDNNLLVSDQSGLPMAQWEMVITRERKDLLESDYKSPNWSDEAFEGSGYSVASNGVSLQDLDGYHLQTLRDWAKDSPANTKPPLDRNMGLSAEDEEYADINYLNNQYAMAIGIYKLLSNGVRDVEVNMTTLRKTILVPLGENRVPVYDVANYTLYDGLIISKSTLIDVEGAPEWIHNVLPTGDEDDANTPALPANAIDKTHGFKKNVLAMSETTEGRVQVIIEYIYGLWAVDIYGGIVRNGTIDILGGPHNN